MRASEIERYNFLRGKMERGEQLTDKETERFNSLALQYRQERNNGGNNDGRIVTNPSVGSIPSVPANPGTSSGAIGNEAGESPAADGGNRTGTVSDTSGTDSGTDSRDGTDSESCGRNRSDDGSSSAEDRNAPETDGGNQRSDSADADSGKQPRGKTARVNSKENAGLANLKPLDVAPKRMKTGAKETSKKATGGDTTTDTIAALFVAGFGMMSALTGREHWAITEKEGEKIAAPMETMLANLPAKTKKIIEKYTAPAIFGAALAEVIIPRVMIDLTATKGKQNNERNQFPAGSSGVGNINPDDKFDSQRGNNPDTASAVPSVNPTIAGLFEQSNF